MANQQARISKDISFTDILADVFEQEIRQTSGDVGDSSRLTLRLTDLIEDTNGEVVLFNDSHLPRLAVVTDISPVDRGEVGRHVTVNGDDVTGFHYIAFGNGLKLYYQDGLDLLLVDDNVHA
ncbi:MAG: hypothetical protein H6851_00665 [Geminicoccaceae bacterium]|nr:hypothetical protein [Geminicoccaceae bacterium]MCB9942119.1 hypothetical protein [Geminicoccaceae bacterium]